MTPAQTTCFLKLSRAYFKALNYYEKVRWESLLRSGTDSERKKSPNLFYPVYIDINSRKIVGCGGSKPLTSKIEEWDIPIGTFAIWPVKSNGSEARWRCSQRVLLDLASDGYAKSGKMCQDGKGTIWYLGDSARRKIASGEFEVVGIDEQGAKVVTVKSASEKTYPVKTVWNRSRHHAGWYGTNLVGTLLPGRSFPFPKSIYSVQDSLRVVVRGHPEAIVLDFFAGSGTTLHAVNLLNKFDSGKRRCILVTNNEVSEDDSEQLKKRNILPGQQHWEQHGICQSVTWSRSKYTILGKRDDGTELEGEYFTGKSVEIEKHRAFHQIAFTSIANLNTLAKKKQLVALIDGLPQSEVKRDSAFIVSEKHPASILFDDTQADAWLEALEDQDHITVFYIVTASKATFDDLKGQIHDLLGPAIVAEEEKLPMRKGFPANLEYFRLEFLDKDQVALGRQFRQILPLLWLRAGAVGPRPELPEEETTPAMMIPEKNPFAVLVDETRFADFADVLASRSDVTHAFLVTDSEEAFHEMAGQLTVANVIQLYRDYLENFVINKAENLSK